jgi:hypothetical protein
VLLGGRDLSQAEIESLNLFVRRGGGLVAAQTGWGWQQIAARGGPAPDMRTNALNRLLLDAGIGWTDEIVDETAPDGFDMNASAKAALDVMSLDGALDKLIGAAGPSRSPELRQASATASRAVRLLPETDQRVRPRLRALLNEHAKELTPTEKTPLRSDRPLLRMLMSVQRDDLKSLPAERVPAHPASASFPGAVSADAPRVSRTMTLPATFRGWQSTGLYAAPGEVVTITRRPDGEGPWTVRIGVHTDTLWHLPEWKRVPEIVRVWSVPAGETKIASAFGGLISIERSKSGPVEVTIEGAVEAPRFVLGQTTREQWEALRRAPAPWGEIETPSIVISAPSTALRAIDDPTALAQVWQSVLDHAADLRAIPRQRGVGERIVPDVQISAGYMHSGYPIMTHLDVVSALTQVQLLSKGEDASWGFFHELGHNHQDGLWTFDGTVEVTCNLWSLYLMEKIAGKPVGTGHDALEPREKREQRMRKHLGTGAKFERWKADPFLALEMYIQIREEFGWEPFKKVFAEYDALAEKDRPRTDVEKHEQWMVRMSRATGRNLGPFFERWGVPTGEAARASIADLPEWMPAGMPR